MYEMRRKIATHFIQRNSPGGQYYELIFQRGYDETRSKLCQKNVFRPVSHLEFQVFSSPIYLLTLHGIHVHCACSIFGHVSNRLNIPFILLQIRRRSLYWVL